MSVFKVGDVVVLKSGGPEMTCSEIDKELGVCCEWFVGTERKIGRFLPGVLISANTFADDDGGLSPQSGETNTIGFLQRSASSSAG